VYIKRITYSNIYEWFFEPNKTIDSKKSDAGELNGISNIENRDVIKRVAVLDFTQVLALSHLINFMIVINYLKRDPRIAERMGGYLVWRGYLVLILEVQKTIDKVSKKKKEIYMLERREKKGFLQSKRVRR